MANELAKALKQKRDAELRLQNQTQKPVVVEKSDGSYYAPEPQDYTSQLAAGKNISILTSGNIKTINALLNILAGSNITVSDPDITGAVTISAAIPQASDGVIGGIMAKTRTTESSEVAIDTATGKLYAPSGGAVSAENVSIADTTGNFTAVDVEGALSELFTYVSNGKTLIAVAITDKGITTSAEDTFATMAMNISNISSGGSISGSFLDLINIDVPILSGQFVP